MRGGTHHVLCLLLLIGCSEQAEPPPAAAASSEALRAAWRESITRRSAWQALVDNIPSLEKDEARIDRLMIEHRVLARLPLSSDARTDAGEYASVLTMHADRLGLGRIDRIEVLPGPPGPPHPAEVLASQGVQYADDQIMGTHALTLRFPNRALAEKLINGLAELDRRPLLDRLEEGPDGQISVYGRVPFLRDLKPTRIEPDVYDVEAILKSAGGDPTSEAASKLRENYKQIQGLAVGMKAACALEARLKLKTARYRAFTKFSEALEKTGTWATLSAPAAPAPVSAPPAPASTP